MDIWYFEELKAKQRHAFYILEAGDFLVLGTDFRSRDDLGSLLHEIVWLLFLIIVP